MNRSSCLMFAIMCLLPVVGGAQTAEDARMFLERSIATSGDKVVDNTITCSRMEFRSTFEGTTDVVLVFSPRNVTADFPDNPKQTILFTCINPSCMKRPSGRFSSSFLLTTVVGAERVVKAFNTFQASCGGPVSSSF